MKRDETVNGRATLLLNRAWAALWRAGGVVAVAGALTACGNSPWPDDSERANVIRSAMPAAARGASAKPKKTRVAMPNAIPATPSAPRT